MYLQLVGPTVMKDHKTGVLNRISEVDSGICSFERFTVDDVKESVKNIKSGKTCGIDKLRLRYFVVLFN